MDTLQISGLRVITLIGRLPHERELPQPVEIDLTLECDLGACGRSDEISDTIDYATCVDAISRLVRESRDQLIERLAERIAQAALRFPRVHAATVSIKKLHAPIPHELRDVAVKIRRTLADLELPPRPPSRAIVALGANLGDRLQYLRFALAELAPLTAVSSIYETAPVGGPAQGDYLNMVAVVHTGLDPYAFLRKCQRIESDAGRTREIQNGPRTLDLDLIFYDDVTLTSPTLTLPHPRYAERGFVLLPLFEVAPELCPKDWRSKLEKSAVVKFDAELRQAG